MRMVLDQNIKESMKSKAPAYTFGGRFKSKVDPVSPSPNAYNTTGITTRGRVGKRYATINQFRSGKSEPAAATLHIKLRDLKKFSTPSPGAYNPQQAEKETKKSAAMYSFGIKVLDKGISSGPGTFQNP
jgi:hypothetical protein